VFFNTTKYKNILTSFKMAPKYLRGNNREIKISSLRYNVGAKTALRAYDGVPPNLLNECTRLVLAGATSARLYASGR